MIFSIFDTVEYQGKLSADIFRNLNYYHKQVIDEFQTVPYTIVGDYRPEQLAHKIYGDSSLYWIIFLINQKIDPYYDWLLSNEATIQNAIYQYQWVGGVDQVHHWYDEDGRWWYNVVESEPRNWYAVNSEGDEIIVDLTRDVNETDEEFAARRRKRSIVYNGIMIPVDVTEYSVQIQESNRTVNILRPDDVSRYISRLLEVAEVV